MVLQRGDMDAIRLEAVKAAFESCKDRLGGISLDQFLMLTEPFEVFPMYANGRLCGAVFVYENHIHACILPFGEGKWFSRKAAKILNRVIENYGEAITTATTEEGRRFVLGLGFIEDNGIFRSSKKWALNRS